MKNKGFLRAFVIFSIFSLVLLSAFSKTENLKIYSEERSNGIDIYADNNAFIPIWVEVEFEKIENLKSSVSLPFASVVGAKKSKVLLISLDVKDRKKGYSLQYTTSYVWGDPEGVSPDKSHLYLFPFEHGKKCELTQGYKGKFSHFDEQTYSLDFVMKVGTPITAARDGIVVEVKEDSKKGGSNESFAEYGNYILIYHKDGTFADYVHLKKNGAAVKAGDRVKAGDVIGYSGNTGWSTGPHLHFSVSIPKKEGFLDSIPVKFLNYNGKGVSPEAGGFYYSFHPGKKKFEIKLGKNITNNTYKNYTKPCPKTGKVIIDTERIDNTFVLFIENGYNGKITASVKFKLKNLVTSMKSPVSIEVPPLSKVFLCFLRLKDPLKGYSYNYSLECE